MCCSSLSRLAVAEGQRWAATASSTGGSLTYPTWSAPSTEDRKEDLGLCTRLVSKFHYFFISSYTSGKKRPGLRGVSFWPRSAWRYHSSRRLLAGSQEAPTPNRAHPLPWTGRLGARHHCDGGPPRCCRGAQCNPAGC